MSEEKRYIQFPLFALQMETNPKKRLQLIFHYCLVDKGQAVSKLISDAQFEQECSELPSENLPTGSTRPSAFILGLKRLRCRGGSTEYAQDDHRRLVAFVAAAEQISGKKSPSVRMRFDIFDSARKGEMPYRDFAVFCAFLSIIGRKKYSTASRNRIRAAALGYSRCGEIFEPDGTTSPNGKRLIAKRPDGEKVATLDQCRSAIGRLISRGLIFKFATATRAWPHYSTRSTAMEIAGFFVKKLTLKSAVKLVSELATQTYQKALSATKEITPTLIAPTLMQDEANLPPKAVPETAPQNPQSCPTEPPH